MEDSLQLRGVTPPNSVEAERSVLGAMLQDSGAVLQAAEELEEKGRDHFLEVMNYTQFEMNVATLDVDIDIGDVIGGRDYLTGLYAKKPISGKIWRFADGVESIEYSVEGEDEEDEIA